jgi:hypothetical protein
MGLDRIWLGWFVEVDLFRLWVDHGVTRAARARRSLSGGRGRARQLSRCATLIVYGRPLDSAPVLPLYSSSLSVSACSCSSSRPPATDLVFPRLGSGIDLRSGLLLAHFIVLSFCVRLTTLARDFFQIDSSLKSCPGFTFHGQDFFFFSVCAAHSTVSSSILLFSTRVERPDQRAWSSVHDSVGRYYSCQISVLFSRVDACSQARVFLLFFRWAVGLCLDCLECTQPASNSCLCAAGLSWTLVLSAREFGYQLVLTGFVTRR